MSQVNQGQRVIYRQDNGIEWFGFVVKVVRAERAIVNLVLFNPETGEPQFQHNVPQQTVAGQQHCWRPAAGDRFDITQTVG